MRRLNSRWLAAFGCTILVLPSFLLGGVVSYIYRAFIVHEVGQDPDYFLLRTLFGFELPARLVQWFLFSALPGFVQGAIAGALAIFLTRLFAQPTNIRYAAYFTGIFYSIILLLLVIMSLATIGVTANGVAASVQLAGLWVGLLTLVQATPTEPTRSSGNRTPRRIKRLTLLQFAAHDFNRALRKWPTFMRPEDVFRSLVNERAKASAIVFRGFFFAIVGTLWLVANKSELTLKVALIDISVPVAYVNFAVAVVVFGIAINLINYFILNEFVRIAANRLFRFDAPWVFTIPQDGSNAWTLGFLGQFRFFSSSRTHRLLGPLVVLFVNLPILLVICVIYWTLLATGYGIIVRDGLGSTSGIFTIVAWLLIAAPLLYWMLIRTTFSFHKNSGFIRWVFLFQMYRRIGTIPPRVDDWISERDA